MSAARPTEAEFDELKRQRDAGVAEIVRAACERMGVDPAQAHVHVCGAGSCYCACPDGPCQHKWDGPWQATEYGGTATCSRCGTDAMSHSLRTGP